jgi:hypothetical protein
MGFVNEYKIGAKAFRHKDWRIFERHEGVRRVA